MRKVQWPLHLQKMESVGPLRPEMGNRYVPKPRRLSASWYISMKEQDGLCANCPVFSSV